jgi:hypothetical protein
MVRIASQASAGSAQWFASAIRKSMSSPLLCVRNRAFVDVDAGEFHPRMRSSDDLQVPSAVGAHLEHGGDSEGADHPGHPTAALQCWGAGVVLPVVVAQSGPICRGRVDLGDAIIPTPSVDGAGIIATDSFWTRSKNPNSIFP